MKTAFLCRKVCERQPQKKKGRLLRGNNDCRCTLTKPEEQGNSGGVAGARRRRAGALAHLQKGGSNQAGLQTKKTFRL